ncbi:MAG: DUF4127 family protein [Chitinophagaceae bacterium]
MKTIVRLVILLSFILPVSAQKNLKPSLKILFIPLDDRPPCLQFTQKMGLIADANLVAPPKDLLGRFTTPGQSDKIISWLLQQDLKSFDAAIISIDMLVYGGLVGSRAYDVEPSKAMQRIKVIEQLHKKAPGLHLFVQSVIMRLAPTSDGKNDAFRDDLSKWAEISVKMDDKSRAQTELLVNKIPIEALSNYKKARQRNLQINLQTVDYVKSGWIDFLILSQDDAKPVGVHVQDRLRLVDETNKPALADKIAVQPGADEVSMLLLARALNKHFKLSPRVKAIYSSETASNTIMPFEDKPLKETVSFHIHATGAKEVQDEKQADLLFFVFASRREPGRAGSFAAEIETAVKQGKRVIVADIDPVGDVQGGDSAFTMEILNRRLFPELNGYASWNTAANTIGTALPQGVVFNVAEKRLMKDKAISDRIWLAQNWFTFHRVMDDYYFHGSVRAKANIYFKQNKLSSKIMDEKAKRDLENYASQLLGKSFGELNKAYALRIANSRQKNIQCKAQDLTFTLPWNRTFEAEISFKMLCQK